MTFDDVFLSLILGLITSIIGTYIYDSIFKNNKYEPAYLFTKNFDAIKSRENLNIPTDSRRNNRRFVFNIFFIVFTLYLLWSSLYVPFVFKAGVMNHTVDLSQSNVANILGISKDYLFFKLENLKWICLIIALFLFFPALYVGTKFSKILLLLKNHFYEATEDDWRRYRFYGVLCFLSFILALHVYLIFSISFLHSILTVFFIILALVTHANTHK